MPSAFIIDLAKKADSGRDRMRSDPAAGDMGNQPDEGDTGDSSDVEGTTRDDMKSEPKDRYSDVVQSALDDLADILRVRESDRDRFDSAFEDLCEACAKRAADEESGTGEDT